MTAECRAKTPREPRYRPEYTAPPHVQPGPFGLPVSTRATPPPQPSSSREPPERPPPRFRTLTLTPGIGTSAELDAVRGPPRWAPPRQLRTDGHNPPHGPAVIAVAASAGCLCPRRPTTADRQQKRSDGEIPFQRLKQQPSRRADQPPPEPYYPNVKIIRHKSPRIRWVRTPATHSRGTRPARPSPARASCARGC